MSQLRIFSEFDSNEPLLTITALEAISEQLKNAGVRFERWQTDASISPGASQEQVMAAYRNDIDRLIAEKGFRSVDVVSVTPDHPDREAMRKKFLDEHFHKEDEVRFFVAGSGLFTLHIGERIFEVTCEQGDLIGIPDGTRHWFDMGAAPYFIAIRFFTEPNGWMGYFTGTDLAQRFPRFERDDNVIT